MRADIHDGPEHNTLQSEAGYIDARPHLPGRRNLLQRAAGPYTPLWHTRNGHRPARLTFRAVDSDRHKPLGWHFVKARWRCGVIRRTNVRSWIAGHGARAASPGRA